MDDSLFDPITMQSMMQALPEIQQRQRRVQQLRGAQQAFQAMQQQPGNGNYVPTQQGGLFPTVAQRIPDYAKAGNQITGALGGLYANSQANNAEDQYNQSRNAQVLKAIQQASGTGGGGGMPGGGGMAPGGVGMNDAPTPATIRGFLGLIGGPDMQNILPPQARVQSHIIGDDGNVYTLMSNGQTFNTGVKAKPGTKLVQDADGNWQMVEMSGANKNTYSPTQAAGAGGGAGGQQPQQQPTNGFDADFNAILANEGSGPNSVSPKGARGSAQLMPATARELEKRFGLPEGISDTNDAINKLLGNVYYQDQKREFKDPAIAAVAYNQGPEATRLWLANGGNPDDLKTDEAKAYFRNFNARMAGGPQATSAVPGGLHSQTAGEKAGAEAQAKQDVELAGMGKKGTLEAAADAQKKMSDAKATASAQIHEQRLRTDDFVNQANALLNDPHLKDIVGGSALSHVADDRIHGDIGTFLMSGSPAAKTMKAYEQIKNNAALQGLSQLRGLGRVLASEFAADASGQTTLDRTMTLQDFRNELMNIRDRAIRHTKAAEDYVNSPTFRPDVEDMQGAPAPAGAQQLSDDDLVNKYLPSK